MRLRLCVFMVLVGGSGVVAQPAAPAPVTEPFLIELPAAPTPLPPTPQPGAKIKLTGNKVYWFSTKTACDVSAYPAGLLKIEFDAVPVGETLRLRDVPFFDGTTTRTFKGPVTAYFVSPAKDKSGDALLTITPLGLKVATDIKRVVFDVDSGTGPQPPPKPDDPVVPPPKPVTSFHVVFVRDRAATHTAAQIAVMDGIVTGAWLDANTTKDGTTRGWRRYDKDQTVDTETPFFKSLWPAVKGSLTTTPCVAIERNGKVDILGLEATPAAQVAVFETYKGGK